MCILPAAATPGVSTPTRAVGPAQQLAPHQRQEVAVAALAGVFPVTDLARDHQVSRKFVYQQRDKAAQALAEAFPPAPSAEAPVLFSLPVTEAWLRRLTVSLLLVCHSSYRGAFELLRDVVGCPRSLGYIHNVAHDAMARARAHNQQQRLDGVRIGAHDEIFQAGWPVLVGVDVDSTYCYLLSREAQRDGDTWGVRLLELQDAGFAPQALISDGGAGLQAGHALALPAVPRRGDVFHVLHEVRPVVAALETRAYQALEACARLEAQQVRSQRRRGRCDSRVSQRLRYARPAAGAAVALADDVATLADWLRRDLLALAGPPSAERLALYDFIVAELRARAAQCPQRLNPLVTYLVNQRDAVLAFARQLDADLAALAEEFQVPGELVRTVLQVQERADTDPRRWPAEAALRSQLRGRFHDLSQAVAAVRGATVRASSVVENVNSRLRNYFFLRRHLGQDYLELVRFFLNHRRFLRSEHAERVDHSPAELLTGQTHPHWLELLGLSDPVPN